MEADYADEEIMVDVYLKRVVADELQLTVNKGVAMATGLKKGKKGKNGNESNGKLCIERQIIKAVEVGCNQHYIN